MWPVFRSGRSGPVDGRTAHVVYVHGGGYVHPLTADYWRLIRQFVRTLGEVVVPFYPLAPDQTADEVVPWLLQVEIEAAAATGPPLPTVLIGDSAGGALVLVMGMHCGREAQAA